MDCIVPQGIQPLCIPRKNTSIIYIDSDYTFKSGDTLYMTVKTEPDNDTTDDTALLKKAWVFGTDCDYGNENELELPLSSTDTNIAFGNYTYDIKLVNATNETTIAYGRLVILPVDTLRV